MSDDYVPSDDVIAAAREIEAIMTAKDQAYHERDRLVAALSKLFPASLERHPEEDTDWGDDWRWIVFIQLPAGQCSWHIHDSELGWFNHLPRHVGVGWDGHTTEEKYQRLAALSASLSGTPTSGTLVGRIQSQQRSQGYLSGDLIDEIIAALQ